jgi:hypothetical protein
MIALALAAMSVVPAAVEATGMEPQLKVIRLEASERSWPITCVGHAGEEGVLRVGIPPGTPPKAVEEFTDAISQVASSVTGVDPESSKKSCDLDPPYGESSGPVQQLMFATAGPDPGFLKAAQECGFSRAYWRPTGAADLASFGGRLDPKKYPMVLDAGEDATKRMGPTVCFMQMRPHYPRASPR